MGAKTTVIACAAAALIASSHVGATTGTWRGLVGIDGSYQWREGDFVTDFIGLGVGPAPAHKFQSIGESGFGFGILGGVEWICNQWLLGAELNIDWSNYNDDNTFGFTSNVSGVEFVSVANYDRGVEFGLSGRAGFFLHEHFMPYVRLGTQFSRDELTYSIATLAAGVPDFSSKKDDVWGFVAGVGFEVPIIDYSSLRFEYNYTRTQKLEINDTGGTVTGTHSFHPEQHTAKVAWVLQFS